MGEKFRAWEGSITAAIYWNDLPKSIEIFSNDSSELKFLHSHVSAPVVIIWKGKISFWNSEIWNVDSTLFNEIHILTKSSYLPALLCLEIYFKLSLTFELLDESSSAAKYSFLTYLYQSLVMFLIKMPKDQICFHAVGWSKELPWRRIMIYGRLWTAIEWYFPYKDIWTKSDIFAGSGLEPGGHYVHEGTTLLSHQQLRGRIAGEVGILNNHHGDQDSGDDND